MLDFIFEACILGMLIIQGFFNWIYDKKIKDIQKRLDKLEKENKKEK